MSDENAEIVDFAAERRARRTKSIQLISRVANTGSRPFLGTASDKTDYWCKSLNNPQGRDTVIAEVAVGVLGDLIQAPIPEWTTLPIHQDLHGFYIKDAGYRLDERDVFASKVIHTADIAIADSTTLQHVIDDSNYNRIPMLYAMWFLCNAEDIQYAYNPAADYSVFSLDHGFWFGSHELPWGFGAHTELAGRTSVPALRTPIPVEHWNKAIVKLDNVNNDLAHHIHSAMPTNWEIEEGLSARIASYISSRKNYAREQLVHLRNTKGGR